MKKDSFKLIIMSVAVICIVIAGIMVPGIVLEANQKSEHDHVAKVPKSYLPSGSVMAKEASVNLKLSEKLSLIDGQWDSTTDDAASYEMDEQDYQAVATCRKSMEKLYEEKLYPVNLSPDYSNWYTWEAAAKKASDNTFNTYTAYYWIIRLYFCRCRTDVPRTSCNPSSTRLWSLREHMAAFLANHATFSIYLHKSATKYVSAAHVYTE